MKIPRRRGVSVIVATLLVIAMTVGAGLIVYVFTNGLAAGLTRGGGGSVNERLTIQGYTFAISPGSCGCAQQIIEMFLFNPGPSSTTISTMYYDGVILTLTTPPTADTPLASNLFYLVPSSTTMASGTAGDIRFSVSTQFSTYSVTNAGQVVIECPGGCSAVTSGSGHTVKVVSTTGAQNVFTVIAGTSG